jgi:hypothetical protein
VVPVPGPLPNPAKSRSRHGARAGTGKLFVLPITCDDPVPDLPPGREWSDAERETWDLLWTGPQANRWDDSFVMAVAMYVSHTFAVLGGQGSAWHAQEARHLGDRLGLTPAGMAALGWALPDTTSAPVVPLRGA